MAKKVRSFSISDFHKKRLKEIAHKEGRSMSNTISHIIDKYIEENGS